MKIIQLSDIHLNGNKKIKGSNPNARFKKAINHILLKHLDTDKIVITGDLTHGGKVVHYEELKNILISELKTSNFFPPHLIIGNHDNRKNFRKIFKETKSDKNGFIQYVIKTEVGDLIFLDTNLDGRDEGHYCTKRQKWLINQLSKSKNSNNNVYLFMHHNPMFLDGLGSINIDLLQKNEFKKILIEYRKVIKHIFFGHCHLNLSGDYVGIPFSAPNSTNHATPPNFKGNGTTFYSPDFSPNYNVIKINKDNLTIYTENFLISEYLEK